MATLEYQQSQILILERLKVVRLIGTSEVDWAICKLAINVVFLRSDLSVVVNEIAQGSHIVPRSVLVLELPGLIVLRILPAPIKFIYFLLRLSFYLHIIQGHVVKIQFCTFLLIVEPVE